MTAVEETASVERDLAAAERAGLRLALIGRTLVLLPVVAWYGGLVAGTPNPAGAAAVGLFMAAGLVHLALLLLGRERPWHRYALVTLDAVGIGLFAVLTPLSTGGEVPQILVFRAYGVAWLFLLPAIAALSLSPRLVLYAGAAAALALWAAFGVIVAGMERTVSWGDLPAGADAATYLSIFLDPVFIGTGNRVEESMALVLVAALLALAVARARRLVRDRAWADRQRARAEAIFGRYVPPAVAAALLRNADAMAPQSRQASVLFCDVEGFTTLSERHSPAEVIALLDAVFDRVTAIVAESGGVVVSFGGDAVLAAFNTPLPLENHAAAAVACGRRLLTAAATERFAGETLTLRVGVATGPVAAGSVGGADRRAWTVYGDTVNVAQRLEAMNKELGTRLLISEATRADLADEGAVREVGTVALRGRAEPMRVFAADS
ncbi:MAG: adenylate/guanylate cyclase domain-containing protein [Alphaproteobacteria bacterium]|jgi:class 3 adenylate cyclase|nr:adenylate/guanylate cyclase domain-containing protein [Alphaproteobacteria bacterium]